MSRERCSGDMPARLHDTPPALRDCPSRCIVRAMKPYALLACLLLPPSALADPAVVGRASVVDGDTIDIGGERVRLNGVDAPESWQRCEDEAGKEYRCGKEAAEALDAFLSASRPTRCEFVDRDRNKRFVGICFRADGTNVNAWMVEQGHAMDWPRYSKYAYASLQKAAHDAKRGIWRGWFVLPCDARAKRGKHQSRC